MTLIYHLWFYEPPSTVNLVVNADYTGDYEFKLEVIENFRFRWSKTYWNIPNLSEMKKGMDRMVSPEAQDLSCFSGSSLEL